MVQPLAYGPFATLAAATLLLLCTHAIFQTVTCAQENGREENIDPKELARELRAEICASNVTQVGEFYREIIEEGNSNVTYPDQSKLPHEPQIDAG